jgi:hypothetical protein
MHARLVHIHASQPLSPSSSNKRTEEEKQLSIAGVFLYCHVVLIQTYIHEKKRNKKKKKKKKKKQQ